MIRIISVFITTLLLSFSAAQAQQANTWIQIEARPNQPDAQERINVYSIRLQDVNGFALRTGWFAVALGPYPADEAPFILENLRNAGLIPQDSYIAQRADYLDRFWPDGNAPATAANDALTIAETEPEPELTPEAPAPQAADETLAQARDGERLLSKEERADLQTALKWAGFYAGGIDASFGRGTRNSMADWQAANNFESTGVLTTFQRAELLRQYNAVLEGMDMQRVRDETAGISVRLPLGVVAFDKYDAPFAHFERTGDVDAKILLISQEGDRQTLSSLYDIMQTLEIAPLNGPRKLSKNSFTLIGENAYSVSHTQVWLKDGAIKGFTLLWPSGDEERRTRLLQEIQGSFSPIDGVLDPTLSAAEDPRVDLIAGLQVRQPKRNRSGVYVDQTGTVVTTLDATDGCAKLTIDRDFDAEILARDDTLGVAILRPLDALAPIATASFTQVTPRIQSEVIVAGYSYGGLLNAPTVTFGKLADIRGLNGEEDIARLSLSALDGDAGGPVVGESGATIGVLLPGPQKGKKLPEGVSFAAMSGAVQEILQNIGVASDATTEPALTAPEDLNRRAIEITALVSCWE